MRENSKAITRYCEKENITDIRRSKEREKWRNGKRQVDENVTYISRTLESKIELEGVGGERAEIHSGDLREGMSNMGPVSVGAEGPG